MAVYSKDFTEVFSNLLKKSGVTCYQIRQYAHLDEGYLSRLKNGEKHDPSPETIIRICLALAFHSKHLKLYHFEKLFNAAGRSLFPNNKSNPYY